MSHLKFVFIFVTALATLAACSSDPEAGQAAAPAAEPAPQPAQAAPEDPLTKMARAVGGKTGAAVDLRYDILAKPAVGTPTDIEIALVPGQGVSGMEVTIGGMEGITLSGPLVASFPAVEPGTAYKHTFSVLPDRAGVYYVTVSVNSQMGDTTMGRTFSIPLAVGDVQAQQKATVEPPKDATGQPIQSMKAQEEADSG